jgi:hypothetical protein
MHDKDQYPTAHFIKDDKKNGKQNEQEDRLLLPAALLPCSEDIIPMY